jgi:hypothetical protein
LAAIGLYLALYGIAGDTTEDAVIAPWWALALIPIGTVLVVVAATILPGPVGHANPHRRCAPLRVGGMASLCGPCSLRRKTPQLRGFRSTREISEGPPLGGPSYDSSFS